MPNTATIEVPIANPKRQSQNTPLTDATEPSTIAARAYELWIERGCPIGSPEEDWFRAEQERAYPK